MSEQVVTKCKGKNKAGVQCKRNTTRGVLCAQHLKSDENLQIKKSTIPKAGLGLYTTIDRKKGEKICDYTGKLITTAEAKQNNSGYVYNPFKGIYRCKEK
jgi:hypothetical protein